jgi:hypothetical protein
LKTLKEFLNTDKTLPLSDMRNAIPAKTQPPQSIVAEQIAAPRHGHNPKQSAGSRSGRCGGCWTEAETVLFFGMITPTFGVI